MRVGYSCLRKSWLRFPKQLLVALGLFALPLTTRFEKVAAKPVPAHPPQPEPKPIGPAPDPRTLRLKTFFSRLHCPVIGLSEDFIHASDANHLDWRLLPSISVIESGGGKAYKNNNIFGWNNGVQPFASIRSGIREVAFKLGRSPLYRNRDVVGKLRLYNPNESYAPNVVSVMNRISPVVNLRPVRQQIIRQQTYAYAND
jgi:hypothetical protein